MVSSTMISISTSSFKFLFFNISFSLFENSDALIISSNICEASICLPFIIATSLLAGKFGNIEYNDGICLEKVRLSFGPKN